MHPVHLSCSHSLRRTVYGCRRLLLTPPATSRRHLRATTTPPPPRPSTPDWSARHTEYSLIRSLSPLYFVHRARNAPRPSCSSLVASRQAPNLPRTTTNKNPRTLPFQTRFRAPSGLFRRCGGEGLQLPDLLDYDWRSSDSAGRYGLAGEKPCTDICNVGFHNDC